MVGFDILFYSSNFPFLRHEFNMEGKNFMAKQTSNSPTAAAWESLTGPLPK
jgi:hypothetical protein